MIVVRMCLYCGLGGICGCSLGAFMVVIWGHLWLQVGGCNLGEIVVVVWVHLCYSFGCTCGCSLCVFAVMILGKLWLWFGCICVAVWGGISSRL